MKRVLLISILLHVIFTNAQQTNNLYTIVAKMNPDFGSTIRLGSFNPNVGLVRNIGTATSQNNISIYSGSVNQITNRFNLMTESSLMSIDLANGEIVSELPVNSFYSGPTYFTNVRYNYSNNTLYGLASTFTVDNTFVGMYLAKLNSETGNLTALSQSSIGNGYQYTGTAIDPQLMVYYYSTGSKFVGLDLYNGNVYSNPDIVFSNPNDFNFANFAYNCADNTIYGLIAEDTNVQNPNAPFPLNIYLMRFGKINPATGQVTHISETPLPTSSYSLNAGSTIDPLTNTYYYCDGPNVYGISLTTGLVVSSTTLTYEDGSLINFMTNHNNCLGAVMTRLDGTLSNTDDNLSSKVMVYPNPASINLTIDSADAIDGVEVIDGYGRVVQVSHGNATTLNVQNLQNGVYFLKIKSDEQLKLVKFVKM